MECYSNVPRMSFLACKTAGKLAAYEEAKSGDPVREYWLGQCALYEKQRQPRLQLQIAAEIQLCSTEFGQLTAFDFTEGGGASRRPISAIGNAKSGNPVSESVPRSRKQLCSTEFGQLNCFRLHLEGGGAKKTDLGHCKGQIWQLCL